MFIDHVHQVVFVEHEIIHSKGCCVSTKALGTYGLPNLGVKSSYVGDVGA